MTGYDANGSPVEDDVKSAAITWISMRALEELDPPSPGQIARVAVLMVDHYGSLEKIKEWFPPSRRFDSRDCSGIITYFEREQWRGLECRDCGAERARWHIPKGDFTLETWKYCDQCLAAKKIKTIPPDESINKPQYKCKHCELIFPDNVGHFHECHPREDES